MNLTAYRNMDKDYSFSFDFDNFRIQKKNRGKNLRIRNYGREI